MSNKCKSRLVCVLWHISNYLPVHFVPLRHVHLVKIAFLLAHRSNSNAAIITTFLKRGAGDNGSISRAESIDNSYILPQETPKDEATTSETQI